MKLNATIGSERDRRAVKKSGHEYLDIDLTVEVKGKQIDFGRYTLREGETPAGLEGIVLVDENDEPVRWIGYEKDKPQKSRMRDCSNCGERFESVHRLKDKDGKEIRLCQDCYDGVS